MIVRKNLSLKKVWRYTNVKMRWVVAGIALEVGLYYTLGQWGIRLNIGVPMTILGAALSILLGFKNNSAYERWWEAARLWDKLLNESRNFGARVIALTGTQWNDGDIDELLAMRRGLIYRQIAFAFALKRHLRRQDVFADLPAFLSESEIERLSAFKNVPNGILFHQHTYLQNLFERGYTEDFRHIQFDNQMSVFYEILGGCERLKTMPFPRQYTVYTDWTLKVFLLFLPVTLGEEMGWLMIPFSFIVGFVFVVLGYVGDGIEQPFEFTVNDMPMRALARTIEIDLRQYLGETELPDPEQPIDGYLY